MAVENVVQGITVSGTVNNRLDPKRWISAVAGTASDGSNWADGTAPAPGDNVLFGSYGVGDCDWDITTEVGDFEIESGYTGEITNSAVLSNSEYRQDGGTVTQGAVIDHLGDFYLTGGTYDSSAAYPTYYRGDFRKTGGAWGTSNQGQIIMMTDGSEMETNDDINCSHLGFRASVTVKDSAGVFRCITQFYCISSGGAKTLTLDNSKIRIYHVAVSTNMDITAGLWTIASTNGGAMQIALYDNKTLHAQFSNATWTCDLELLGISGCVANVELATNQNIDIGQNNDVLVYCEDAVEVFEADTGGYHITCHDLTVSTRGYLEVYIGALHIYGSFDVSNSTAKSSGYDNAVVNMYTDGESINVSGYTNRIKWLILVPASGTIDSLGGALVLNSNGGIDGNGCTLAVGDNRLYQYSYSRIVDPIWETPMFAGTGTITSSDLYGSGYWFIGYALSEGLQTRNVHQGNWTFDCNVFIAAERSMGYTIHLWQTGSIITSKKLYVAGSGSYGLKLHCEGFDLEGSEMRWNTNYSSLTIVDASVGSSEFRVTGGHFVVYKGYVQFDRGLSHVNLSGTGLIYPGDLHYHDFTISGSYTLQYGDGWVHGDRLGVNFAKVAPWQLITVREYQQGLTVSPEPTRWDFLKKLTQELTLSCEIFKTPYQKLVESLVLRSHASVSAIFTPDIEAQWLGSFPRPSLASITIQLKKATGEVLTNATVIAVVNRADNGEHYRDVTFAETSTLGVYKGFFRVYTRDPVGTYPVTVTATYGINSVEQDGYVIIYAGAPTGIRYH